MAWNYLRNKNWNIAMNERFEEDGHFYILRNNHYYEMDDSFDKQELEKKVGQIENEINNLNEEKANISITIKEKQKELKARNTRKAYAEFKENVISTWDYKYDGPLPSNSEIQSKFYASELAGIEREIEQLQERVAEIDNKTRELKAENDILDIRISDEKYTPYRKVAKEALMSWNGLSEEEASDKVRYEDFDELEGQVYAKDSMQYAIDGIIKYSKKEGISEIDFNDKDNIEILNRSKERLEKYIFGDDRFSYSQVLNGEEINLRREMFFLKDINPEELALTCLESIHDGWVKDNQKKFMAREKKHQHMPLELIGWKEAKSDLLFLRPILEATGIEVDEQKLEKAYNDKVKRFFRDRKITSKEDLIKQISNGAEFYPALEGQEDIISALSDNEFVRENVISQVEEKGIGDIDRLTKEAELQELQEEDDRKGELLQKAQEIFKLQENEGKTAIDD